MLQASIRNPSGKVLSYATGMSVSGLFNDSNVARSDNGVASLVLDSQLNAAAQAKANDMATRNYWSHNTPEGNPPWVFVSAQDYSYQKLGENLAAGFSDEQAVINGWMVSAGHRANLLDPEFSDVGFGYANNPDYTSAGGGPMTIVVSFYGKPTVAAPQSSPPPAAAPTSQPPASNPQVKSDNAANAPSAADTSSSVAKEEASAKSPDKANPASTTTQTPSTNAKSLPTSRAKIAFARLPAAGLITSIVALGAFVAAGIWISRHGLKVRRALKHGEKFAFSHPLFDLGLFALAILSFLLSKTAGFIL